MGTKTGIEWTDATWNPIRGCTRVSEGCRNCYAERVAYRFSGEWQPYAGLAVLKNGHASWTGKVEFVEKHLLDPLKWKTPRRIFVNSMSDLFHEGVTDEMRDRIFAVMALCPQHTFQVLTKRPERMLKYLGDKEREAKVAFACVRNGLPLGPGYFSMKKGLDLWEIFGKPGKLRFVDERVNGGVPVSTTEWRAADFGWPLPNVHLGVSVENQKAADDRIESLLRTPAAVRFLSVEPMLGPVNLNWVGCECDQPDSYDGVIDCLGGFTWIEEWDSADGSERTVKRCQTIPKIDWVICGGESGPGARPMHPDWARSLRDQCVAAGVPFFFKQWGEWVPFGDYCGGPVAVSYEGRKRHYSAAWAGDFETRKIGGVIHAGGDAARGVCVHVGKKAAGALLDGREWKQFPSGL